MTAKYICIFIAGCAIAACTQNKVQETTPWGTTLGEDTAATIGRAFSFEDIQRNGELIMLTLTGPDTYYDYRGRGMGTQYLLLEKFCQKIGVALRVEVCRDTAEMVRKLKSGDGDVIAFQLPHLKDLQSCGVSMDSAKTSWAVDKDNVALADTLSSWFKPEMIAQVKKEEDFMLSTRSITRRVYSPMLNRTGGVISHYDHYFKQYAPVARWDWRLLAAQCYQESTFDTQAKSWAGARGLMQIMPATAAHLGLSMDLIHEPEPNIAAAVRYIKELNGHFMDIANPQERCYFVLASYNGGFFHIRDAMALARKYGRNPHQWSNVSEFVLKLSTPAFYNDPIVKHGYMRGSETVDYVQRIRSRWSQYCGFALPSSSSGFNLMEPQKAKHKNKFDK